MRHHTKASKIGGTIDATATTVVSPEAKVRQDQTALISIAGDEVNYAQQPSVMRRIAGTTVGTLAVAYFTGTSEPMGLGLKAVYSLMAQVIGLNAEIYFAIPHLEHAVTAGVYYSIAGMSFAVNNKVAYEAIGGAAGGFAGMSM